MKLQQVLVLSMLALTFISCVSPNPEIRRPSGKPVRSFTGSVQRLAPITESEMQIHFFAVDSQKVSVKNYNLLQSQDAESFLADLGRLQEFLNKADLDNTTDETLKTLDQKGILAAIGALVHYQTEWKTKNRNPSEQSLANSLELIASVNNNFMDSVKLDYQLFTLPVYLHKLLAPGQPVEGPQASNLTSGSNGDLSLRNPWPSSVWQVPAEISDQELFMGFGRSQRNLIDGLVCTFEKPKTGAGVHPGFQIRCPDLGKFKVKFGDETYSGPFNTRIYNLLGYHVPIIDYVAAPEFTYDRKIISQFNMRHVETIHFNIGSKSVFSLKRNSYKNPFNFIKSAVLENGEVLTSSDLEKNLLKKPGKQAELNPDNYNEDFEKRIKTLIFQEGSITQKDEFEEVGSWAYSDLDHATRREIRGLQILAAWVGNFDMRMDNTRLGFYKNADGSLSLQHQLSDVGSGLGKANTIFVTKNATIQKMDWTVSETKQQGDKEKIELVGLMTTEINQAFRSMTMEDAQWMVRMLAQISEPQMIQALAATGMSAAELKLALEKLVSRRNKLITDFKLESELGFAIRKIDRKLSYDPQQNEPWIIQTPQGPYTIPVKNMKLASGKLQSF